MSTNSECLFFKWKTGFWYYLLEDTHAPKNAWDWRDNAACYGPYQDEEDARKYLHMHHANPGGSSTEEEPDFNDKVLQDHVKHAVDESIMRSLRDWRPPC